MANKTGYKIDILCVGKDERVLKLYNKDRDNVINVTDNKIYSLSYKFNIIEHNDLKMLETCINYSLTDLDYRNDNGDCKTCRI